LIAAARRRHKRYRAVPTVIGLATGFTVGRPPTDLADAERLAIEHQVFAGLTARDRLRTVPPLQRPSSCTHPASKPSAH
jgi:hypothetical protein